MKTPPRLLFFLFLFLGATWAWANPPTQHHSIDISVTVIRQGNSSSSLGPAVFQYHNLTLLKLILENSVFTGLTPAQCDIVADDDSGQIDVIRRSDLALVYTIAHAAFATENSSFAVQVRTGFILYRFYSSIPFYLPNFSTGADLCASFTNVLDNSSAFRSASANFFGGNSSVGNPYLIRAQYHTGPRTYTYSNAD